jgi:hypothetical protein
MDERNDYNSIPLQHTKTAMQELIFELKLIEAYPMITLVLRIANDLLDKEKEQIIDAFWNGDNSDCTSEQNAKEFAEQYYNQTYSQDRELGKEVTDLLENYKSKKNKL